MRYQHKQGPSQMLEALTESMGDAPLCVLQCIAEYATLSVLGGDGLADSRVVLEGCQHIELRMPPALEVVLRQCTDCSIETADIGRMIRVYGSKRIGIQCKGQCSSYRFEKCRGVNVEAKDIGQKTVFIPQDPKKITIRERKWH